MLSSVDVQHWSKEWSNVIGGALFVDFLLDDDSSFVNAVSWGARRHESRTISLDGCQFMITGRIRRHESSEFRPMARVPGANSNGGMAAILVVRRQ
jgi:hypothetical protein